MSKRSSTDKYGFNLCIRITSESYNEGHIDETIMATFYDWQDVGSVIKSLKLILQGAMFQSHLHRKEKD